DLSAHEMIRRAHREVESWTTLHAEYQTIAKDAQAPRWDALLARSGLGDPELDAVRSSPAQGALMAALRHAETSGLNVEAGLPSIVRQRPLDDADDVAAVLHARVETWTDRAGSERLTRKNLIAGLVPRALHVEDPDLARAL